MLGHSSILGPRLPAPRPQRTSPTCGSDAALCAAQQWRARLPRHRPWGGAAGGAPAPTAAAATGAAAASTTATPLPPDRLDDDGSEGSGAQHGSGYAEGRWCESEESRAYRRTSFGWKDWKKHRSNRRYIYHLSTLAASRIVRGVLPPVIVICAFATAICSYHTLYAAQQLPVWAPALPLVPIEPFQLTSFALALLLVFRTNTSYQRWHEARCVFGRIADAARDVLRQVLAVFPRERPDARAAFARWLVAFCIASKWAMREEGRQRADLEGWLSQRELDSLMTARDPPHYAMLVLSHTLRANLAGQQLVKLMDRIGSMMYDLSSCNRILSTPIPLSYTRHTTRFMVLWLALLPLALWAKCGWGCIPAVALISLALLITEAIGVSLEEPFSILALEQICDRLGTSVTNLIAMDAEAYAMAIALQGAAPGGACAQPLPPPSSPAVSRPGSPGPNGGYAFAAAAGGYSNGSSGSNGGSNGRGAGGSPGGSLRGSPSSSGRSTPSGVAVWPPSAAAAGGAAAAAGGRGAVAAAGWVEPASPPPGYATTNTSFAGASNSSLQGGTPPPVHLTRSASGGNGAAQSAAAALSAAAAAAAAAAAPPLSPSAVEPVHEASAEATAAALREAAAAAAVQFDTGEEGPEGENGTGGGAGGGGGSSSNGAGPRQQPAAAAEGSEQQQQQAGRPVRAGAGGGGGAGAGGIKRMASFG